MKRQGSVEATHVDNHAQIFSLRRLHPNKSSPFDFTLCLHPSTIKPPTNNLLSQQSEPAFTIPRLNIQKNPFTPLFTIDQSEVDLCPSKSVTGEPQKNSGKEHLKIKQSAAGTEQILIAKPSSQYCSVCKVTYTDYLHHIKQDLHLLRIRKSDKELKFSDLVDSLKKKEKEKRRERPLDEERGLYETRKRKMKIIEDVSSFSQVGLKLSRSMSESTCNPILGEKGKM